MVVMLGVKSTCTMCVPIFTLQLIKYPGSSPWCQWCSLVVVRECWYCVGDMEEGYNL